MARISDGWSDRRVEIDAKGFYDGSQNIPPEQFLKQIEAGNQKSEAVIREKSEHALRKLEARAETLTHLEPQARARWEQMRERHQGDPPQVLVPLFLLALACLALLAEASLLAPVLDMFGVTEPMLQFLLALAYGFVSVVVFHLTLAARESGSPIKHFLQITSAALLLTLGLMGVLRAKELAFAAGIAGNPLGEFLAGHRVLSQLVIAAFSVLFPLCGAFALHHAVTQLREWWEFHKARRRAHRLQRQLSEVMKKIESTTNRLEHEVAALRKQGEEWKASYLHHWEFGKKCGAKKGPQWLVWAKAAATALGVLVVLRGLLPLFGIQIDWVPSMLAASFAGAVAAVYFYRKWDHPSPEELLRRAHIEFRSGTKGELEIFERNESALLAPHGRRST